MGSAPLHGIFEDALCFGNSLVKKEKSLISDEKQEKY
jgi:hypothetical protein